MTTTKPHTEQTSAIRPVLCAVCEQRLYYYGDARAEPEMVVTIQFRNADYSHRNDGGGTFYVHERCFDGFQVRFSESSVSPASTAPVVDEDSEPDIYDLVAQYRDRMMTEPVCVHCELPIALEQSGWIHVGSGLVTCRRTGLTKHDGVFRAEPAAATAAPVGQSEPSSEAVRRARDWLNSYEAEKHYEGIDQMFRYVAQLITDLLPANKGAR